MTRPDDTVVLFTPHTDELKHQWGSRQTVYIRNHPTVDCQWRGTDGSIVRDSLIDYWNGSGAITELLSPRTMPINTADLVFALSDLEPLGSYADEAEEAREQQLAEDRIRATLRTHKDIDWDWTSHEAH